MADHAPQSKELVMGLQFVVQGMGLCASNVYYLPWFLTNFYGVGIRQKGMNDRQRTGHGLLPLQPKALKNWKF